MTARVITSPTTTWKIQLTCDADGCPRHAHSTETAVSQAAALQQARLSARTDSGWSAAAEPVGDGRSRGFNVVDRCPVHTPLPARFRS